MNAIDMIKERRSVRKYKDEVVSRELMEEIIDITRWTPSWANFQVARFTMVDDAKMIADIASAGVNDFVYNIDTLKNAKGVAVLSFVKGKSGKLDPDGAAYATTKANVWEVFDSGIACQTFCLAAHAKGIGTCVMGIINAEEISKIVNLPEGETVAALITYGYPDESPAPTPRKSVHEISRWA